MPSPNCDAATPGSCPYADACGACGLVNCAYSDQLASKQAAVQRLLKPFGRVEPIRGMENPLHYRNKVHAVFASDRRGRLIAGTYRVGTHTVVPVEACLVENRRASAVIATVRDLAEAFCLPPYDEDRRTGFLRHALVRVGEREMMLVLVTAKAEFPRKSAFLRELSARHPELTTVVQNLNNRRTTMVLGDTNVTLLGPGYITDTLCGMAFRISPQSFYQVNHTQAEVLYRVAAEMAALRGRETVLDAYCGVGTIGLTMARRCAQLVGVELNPAAVRDAKGNAQRNGITNAHFIAGDAGRFLMGCAARGDRVDTVLMDPPRSGSDNAFLQALLRLSPPTVVYISCDPQTLARDLRVLCAGGYRMRRAVPVDMFPFTEHVETAVWCARS